MHTIILALLALAFLSWVYTSIVLPDVRDSITYKLFALRDELRRHKINHPEVVGDRAFRSLQSIINNSISLTPWISVVTLIQVRYALKQDWALLEDAKRQSKFLQCESGKTVARIYEETTAQFFKALCFNSLQLLAIAIPVMIVYSAAYYLVKNMTVMAQARFWATKVPAIPQSKLEKISPEISNLIMT